MLTAAQAAGAAQAQDGPVAFEAATISDLWVAVDAAGDAGELVDIHQLDVGATLDLHQAVGWRGGTVFLQGSYNNGAEFSGLVGDAQVVSNIDTGVEALRLYEAWLEQQIGARSTLKVGLIDLNTEFDVLESAGLFINSAHGIGTVLGLSGENGPSIFPVTSLGARFDHRFAGDWVLRLAIFDGVPGDPDDPAATAIILSDEDGALLTAEIEAPLAGGRLLFGHWRYTAEFDTLDFDVSDDNAGWYVRGEHALFTDPAVPARTLTGFFRAGVGEGSINPFSEFLGAGLSLTAPFAGREADQVGVAVASAFASDTFRRVASADAAEINLELTYAAQLTPWLKVQPDLQYVINPSADPELDDTLAVGLRVELGWNFGA